MWKWRAGNPFEAQVSSNRSNRTHMKAFDGPVGYASHKLTIAMHTWVNGMLLLVLKTFITIWMILRWKKKKMGCVQHFRQCDAQQLTGIHNASFVSFLAQAIF